MIKFCIAATKAETVIKAFQQSQKAIMDNVFKGFENQNILLQECLQQQNAIIQRIPELISAAITKELKNFFEAAQPTPTMNCEQQTFEPELDAEDNYPVEMLDEALYDMVEGESQDEQNFLEDEEDDM